MKKILCTLLVFVLAFSIVGCGNKVDVKEGQINGKTGESTETTSEKETIVVGTSTISKDVLEVAQKVFNENSEKYKMEIKVFDDGITPNLAVDDGSIDANFYQYEDYLDTFNKDRGTDIKTTGKEIFAFQIGLYSNKIKDISEIKEGMTVALANDATNRALALGLLDQEGIIKIKDGVEAPTILDIEENKYNLEFIEMERLNLANAVDDTDMAIVMSDVMLQAGKDPASALAYAQEDGIVVAYKEEKEWLEELENALTSDEVKKYIIEETQETKTPLF